MGSKFSKVILAAVGAAIVGLASQAHAIIVPVVNGGMNSPDATLAGPGNFYTTPNTPTGWQPPDAVHQGSIGVFYNSPVDPADPNLIAPNPRYITNITSTQSAYIFNAPGLPLYQDVAFPYQVGWSYKLTFHVKSSDATVPFAGAVPDTDALLAILYYGGNPANTIAVLPIAGPTFKADQTLMQSAELNLPAVDGLDPWTNQNIGIMFAVSQLNTGGGVWDVTDVQLTAVPEPASLTLLGAGALAIVARRRRGV